MPNPSINSGQRLPSGTVTFIYTDIEGSTTLAQQFPVEMPALLARHHAILHEAIARHNGHVFQITGDAFCAAFYTARDALQAALDAQRGLQHETWDPAPIKVRMGLHSGTAQAGAIEERAGGYVGYLTLTRVQRVMSTAYGGQVLLSNPTAELLRSELPANVTLRDMGEHRLKSLVNLEHLWQLVAPELVTDFPPLQSLNAIPNNLPVQLTSFIGREKDIAEVKRLLSSSRLVTLTGPGGTGKTRLALQIAADMLDTFKDGVFYVPLASIREPGLVILTLAQIIGVKETIGLSIMEELANILRNRQMLVILDNFEQVTDAAPLVAELLSICTQLIILVTSRELLHLRGEREFPVPPLSLPDFKKLPTLEVLSQYTAVVLFVQRVLAVKPDFVMTNENAPAVAEICARVDGLPLAIELAAARVKLLSPQVMLKRLEHRLTFLTGGARDLPARQQTLRRTIDWSYELLDENEQTFFSRLAVFVGGCTLEAVEQICCVEQLLNIAALDMLSALIDQSLLRQMESGGEPRFGMLEMLREYGLDRLAANGAMVTICQRHADYYLALAEQADPLLESRQQAFWLERLQYEHDNLRAALDWFADTAQAEPGLRLASALWRFWEIRGYLTEGRARLAQMLELPAAKAQTKARMHALYAAGVLADAQCDYATARALFEENLAIHREIGDPWNLGTALNNLGNVANVQGDYPLAQACYTESLQIFRKLGDMHLVGWSTKMLANLAQRQGDFIAARSLYDESLVIFQQSSGRGDIAVALNDLGNVANAQGDTMAARAAYEQALIIFREIDNEGAVAIALNNLGNVVCAQADYRTARALFEQSMILVQKLGDKRGIARLLESFAGLSASQAQPERAVRLAGAAAALRTTLGAPLPAVEQRKIQNILELAQRTLSRSDIDSLWASGAALTLEQAMAFALEGGVPQ